MSQTVELPAPPSFVGYLTDHEQVTTLVIDGSATPEDVVPLFVQFMRRPTPRLLWDLRTCSLANFPMSGLQRMVNQLMRLDGIGRPGVGRSAFVCSSECDALVMRRLIWHAEANDYRIRLALFRDINVARRWLANV